MIALRYATFSTLCAEGRAAGFEDDFRPRFRSTEMREIKQVEASMEEVTQQCRASAPYGVAATGF
jgi:hypothetical protein